MVKLTLGKTGIEYDDIVSEFVAQKFEGVSDYPEAMSAYQEIENMTPEQVSEQAGNKEYDIAWFRKDVMMTAYRALWKFYVI